MQSEYNLFRYLLLYNSNVTARKLSFSSIKEEFDVLKKLETL